MVDLEIYKEACAVYEKVRTQMEKGNYTNQVLGCLNDHSSLFTIINKLLHWTLDSPLPSHDSPSIMAQEFAKIFNNKIVKIKHQLDQMESANLRPSIIADMVSDSQLQSLTTVTEINIIKVIKEYPINS